MNNPRMLFKYPGKMAQLQDGAYDYCIVDEDEVDATVAEGWHLWPADARAAAETVKDEPISDAPPTREELEAKATELGLKFDGRTSDKKLAAAIDEALKV